VQVKPVNVPWMAGALQSAIDRPSPNPLDLGNYMLTRGFTTLELAADEKDLVALHSPGPKGHLNFARGGRTALARCLIPAPTRHTPQPPIASL
jgi:hypothetical protein